MSDSKQPDAESVASRKVERFMMRLFGVVVVCSGAAFVFKLYEFFADLTNREGLHFAGAHLLTYVLVAGGFALLLIYGFMKGQFTDIEKPKFEMLEKEIEYDRQEFDAVNS
ncbi:MAG TPA: hypothetical protein ENK43_17615 [Planctomycetes bacterium]|nr:hypothetical protein [Planctomycetota bacterium]